MSVGTIVVEYGEPKVGGNQKPALVRATEN